MSSNYAPIPIINRMTSILDKVLATSEGISTSELLHTEDIPKTTLYRLLASMTENEFLTYSSETGLYTLGSKFTSTYISLDERVSKLREVALPHLQQLAERAQETVKLTVLSGMQSHTVASFEGTRPLRISIAAGAVFPLHAGASGKVLMCTLSKSSIKRYYELHGFRWTENTIMDVEDMEIELDKIKTQGYATDNGEYLPEILAVAVPVFDSNKQIIASISISYPSAYRESVDIEWLIEQASQTAQTITNELASRENHLPLARLVGNSIHH